MKKLLCLLATPCAMLLAGCENNAASYVIDNTKDHSIALVREQSFAWVGPVEQPGGRERLGQRRPRLHQRQWARPALTG